MSGIFNLLGELTEPDRGQTKSLIKSKTFPGLTTPTKAIQGQVKPKGLSIRPNYDLNIAQNPQTNCFKSDTSKNKQQLLKPKLTQLDCTGRPASPRKKLVSEKLNLQQLKGKDVSPKKKLNANVNLKPQKVSNETIFKMPYPPKKSIKKFAYPPPEYLAPFCNPYSELDDIYDKPLTSDFSFPLKTKDHVIPFEDEGFESEPELILSEMPKLSISPALSDDVWNNVSSPGLPEISDDDDF